MALKNFMRLPFFRAASIYTITNIVNALIPFLLMPVLTRYLTPEDYGITVMMQIMVGLLTPFVGLNLHGAITVKYHQKNQDEFAKFVSNCFFVLCVSSMGVTSILFVFRYSISQITAFPLEWLWTIIVICFGQFLINIVLVILQVSVRPKVYALIQISQVVLNFSMSIYLIVNLNFNWQGRVIAQLVTILVFTCIGFHLLSRWKLLTFAYNKVYVKEALKFGLPLLPHALSGYFISMADRFLITNLIGLDAGGVYAVGAQIGMAIQLLTNSFNQAYAPWLYRNLSQISDQRKIKIVRFTYAYFIGIFIFAILYAYTIPHFLLYFLGEKFHNASDYIFGIALAGAFQGMYFIVANYIFYVGKTHFLAYVTVAMGAVHLITTYYFILWYGSIGATYSLMITQFFFFIFVWILSARIYPMPWFLK